MLRSFHCHRCNGHLLWLLFHLRSRTLNFQSHEHDRSPNLDVDNDFTTVRCMLGMEGAEEDAVGLTSYKRDPCEMGTPTADGYTNFKALFNKHGKRRNRNLSNS